MQAIMQLTELRSGDEEDLYICRTEAKAMQNLLAGLRPAGISCSADLSAILEVNTE